MVDDYTIRQSVPEDSDALGRVHSDVWHEAYSHFIPADILATIASVSHRTAIRHEMVATSTDASGHFLIEDKEGHIVGFGDCGPALSVDNFAPSEIYTLYLLKRVRGKGLGKRLLRKMFEHLSAQGFQSTALKVFAENERSLEFYRYLKGFEVHRIEMDFSGAMLPVAVFAWSNLKAALIQKAA